ncbi:MAG: GNAT family N-acetyltransferase [Aeromicrobium sp.]
MTVTRAEASDVPDAAVLFAAYREFYGEPYDVEAAAAFLADRLAYDESVVLLSRRDGTAVGFTQLYPLFSSTRLAPIWILNDLFVAESARGSGAVDEMLDTAATLAAEAGCAAIELSTAHTNVRAQAVYVRHGYQLDEVFRTYEKPLS